MIKILTRIAKINKST